MDTRRDFLRKAAALGAAGGIPAAIQRALAIEPAPGSTFQDAEHVVILMQENRSFDHCYGSLRGVRGFNDPRAVTLPNGNPVWLQSFAEGATYPPFRLDLKGSNATWLGCLPHDWPDQSRARNGGKHDRWLDNKRPVREGVAHLPLTLGFHTREDLPFYYALADAFTICDQNFCSCLTGTNANRLHLWSGTIRGNPGDKACVRNSDAEGQPGLKWTSFPERLEDAGISWRVYQNELWVHTGMNGEQGPWLGNFGDNALEYFERYGVRFAKRHREFLAGQLQRDLAGLKKLAARPRPWTPEMEDEYKNALKWVEHYRTELRNWSEQNWEALPNRRKDLHRKAFTVNETDPHFRELEEVSYHDGTQERRMKVPRGDVFHQFRADAAAGKLPAVSWLVAPQMFSDHPDSPWYGAWYIAEALDILTSRPDVWRRTIFILCYDENDGYFDHVPPFVPPDPQRPESGKASAGLDTEAEFVRAGQEEKLEERNPNADTHTGPIGLGYRTPLVVASPWSRGGYVCSQVFDHTSILMFLEKWLTKKTRRPVTEPNITAWRRAVCGDLTSVFRPASPANAGSLAKPNRTEFLGSVHGAQFKPPPGIPAPLSAEEIRRARQRLADFKTMPRQEPGTRPACALPYELSVESRLTTDRKSLVLTFSAGSGMFGDLSAGAPFHVYAPGRHQSPGTAEMTTGRVWSYAVAAGNRVEDTWPLDQFANGDYHLRVHGPNGFYREFRGAAGDPVVEAVMESSAEQAALVIVSADSKPVRVDVKRRGSEEQTEEFELNPGTSRRFPLPLGKSGGWYDAVVTLAGSEFRRHFAGRIENGRESISDPLMAS
jgi:phospholipase C